MKYSERQDLLGLALDIHMAYTGSYPDLSAENIEHARSFIQSRLDRWTPPPKSTSLFDTAVKMLLTVAVHEASLIQARK